MGCGLTADMAPVAHMRPRLAQISWFIMVNHVFFTVNHICSTRKIMAYSDLPYTYILRM